MTDGISVRDILLISFEIFAYYVENRPEKINLSAVANQMSKYLKGFNEAHISAV